MNLETPGAVTTPRNHIVKFHEDDDTLIKAAGSFLSEGAKRGEGLIIIATPDHSSGFLAEMQADGVDTDALTAKGHLLVLDAVKTLESLLTARAPDPVKFRSILYGTIDQMLAKHGLERIRAFGEMVDLLAQRGDAAAALRLETYWNHLLQLRPVTLLCGYRMGLLGTPAQNATIEDVCHVHSHASFAEDRILLDHAVERAFEEEIGTLHAEVLRPLIDATIGPASTRGGAEHVLFWVRRNLPDHLESLLSTARRHYLEAR